MHTKFQLIWTVSLGRVDIEFTSYNWQTSVNKKQGHNYDEKNGMEIIADRKRSYTNNTNMILRSIYAQNFFQKLSILKRVEAMCQTLNISVHIKNLKKHSVDNNNNSNSNTSTNNSQDTHSKNNNNNNKKLDN